MRILLFVLLPVLVVAAYATYVWLRNREPTSLESGVDAFRREMDALSPNQAPGNRRPDRPEAQDDPELQVRPEPSGRTSQPPARRRPAPRRPDTGAR